MTAQQEDLVARVRECLAGLGVREVNMFGGVSFMVNDRMLVAARRHGDLLVRANPVVNAELLLRPGAYPATMGTGREMGPSWVSVSADHLVSATELQSWVQVALDFSASATNN